MTKCIASFEEIEKSSKDPYYSSGVNFLVKNIFKVSAWQT